MQKVIFITYDGLTDPLGQSQILPYIIGLTKFGYQFTILSCEKPARLQAREQRIKEIIKDFPINWVPLLYHKSPPVLSSVYDYRKLLAKATELYKKEKFALVHTRPGLPTLVALQLKKKFGVRFLNDVRGFWADERVDGNLWNLNNPLYKSVYRFFKRRENECLRVNDYTTCLTHSAKKEMGKWNIISDKDKVEVIPCSVDLDLFNPHRITTADKEGLRQRLGITPDELVISYLGSVGTWYMMDDMFRFFRQLLNTNGKTKFIIITSAVDHPKVMQYVQKYEIAEEKVILQELDRRDVPLYLSLCRYSLFFIKPCFSKISSSPTKHGEIMAMGIPVITNSGVGDVKEIVEESQSGFVLDGFSEQNYKAVIDKMLTTTFDSKKIREAAKEYYSLEKAIHQYKKVYEAVFKSPVAKDASPPINHANP